MYEIERECTGIHSKLHLWASTCYLRSRQSPVGDQSGIEQASINISARTFLHQPPRTMMVDASDFARQRSVRVRLGEQLLLSITL